MVTLYVFKALIIATLHQSPERWTFQAAPPIPICTWSAHTSERLVWDWAVEGLGAQVWREFC